MAALSALKNKAKIIKKPVPKKAPAKKAAAKKVVAKKVVKIPVKTELTVADIRLLISAKEAVARQKEVNEELAERGITSLNRIPKKIDKPLVDEARELFVTVPALTEKVRKHGIGTPNRALKKGEYALVAPKVVATPTPKMEITKDDTPAVVKIDGEEVELEEVELEDLDALVAEVVVEEPVEDKANAPRVVNLAEENTGNEENAFTLKASEEDDAPAQTVMTAGATADPVKDYLKQIGRVALLNA